MLQIEPNWLIVSALLNLILIIAAWRIYRKRRNDSERYIQPLVKAQANIALDPVTNLPTYQHGISVLEQLLIGQKSEQYAVIACKPLNFGQVNKVLGHQNSDILLLQLAYNLQQKLASHDQLVSFAENEEAIKLCRLHGLDFLLIVDLSRSNFEAKIIIEDICKKIAESVPRSMSFKSFSLSFDLAFGISVSQSSDSGVKLIAQASDALLSAEQSSQRWCFYHDESYIYNSKQLAKMESLKLDIAQEKLPCLAQPKISLKDKSIKGFEITTHWQGAQENSLTKSEFEDLAGFSGQLYLLTKKMIEKAFNVLVIMHRNGVLETVSVNLSSKDILEPELADYIEQQSERTGIDLSFFMMELDESVIFNAPFRARMMIDQLRALKVKIAINNFSGSYQALRYLRKAEIDQVKIDCQQLTAKDLNNTDKVITNALVNLIRKMEIPVVATGINTRTAEQIYSAIEGDIAQGKLFHQGIAEHELQAWVVQWQANSHPQRVTY